MSSGLVSVGLAKRDSYVGIGVGGISGVNVGKTVMARLDAGLVSGKDVVEIPIALALGVGVVIFVETGVMPKAGSTSLMQPVRNTKINIPIKIMRFNDVFIVLSP